MGIFCGKQEVERSVLRGLIRAANGTEAEVGDGGTFFVVVISPPTTSELRMRNLSTKITCYFRQHRVDRVALLLRRRSGSVVSVAFGRVAYRNELLQRLQHEYRPGSLSNVVASMVWVVIRNDESSCCLRGRNAVNI